MWLTNLRIILPNGEIGCGSIQIIGEQIMAVVAGERPANSDEPWFDGRGLIAIPGIIDLCGDLLERELEPRPGSLFPIDAALHEFDKRLAGAGITTACVVLTLDSPDTNWHSRRPDYVSIVARTMIAHHPEFLTDLRVHLLCTPAPAGMDAPALVGLLLTEGLCDLVGLQGLAGDMAKIAEAAQRQHIPLAFHHPSTLADITTARELGVRLCLFPPTRETVQAARNQGMRVAISAPDLVRGQVAAQELSVYDSAADVLVANESPMMLLQAIFMLERELQIPLYTAVALATTNPATVLGLTDRGAIAPGLLADLVIVVPGQLPRIRMTIRRGVPIYRRA